MQNLLNTELSVSRTLMELRSYRYRQVLKGMGCQNFSARGRPGGLYFCFRFNNAHNVLFSSHSSIYSPCSHVNRYSLCFGVTLEMSPLNRSCTRSFAFHSMALSHVVSEIRILVENGAFSYPTCLRRSTLR